MNKKLVFGSMLAVLLVLSLAVIGCKTDSDDPSPGGDGGGSAPTELVGKWYSDAAKSSFAFQIYANGTVDDAPDKPNETFATIKMKSGNGTSGVFTAHHDLGFFDDADITFTTTATATALVVSSGKHGYWIDVGTYYK